MKKEELKKLLKKSLAAVMMTVMAAGLTACAGQDDTKADAQVTETPAAADTAQADEENAQDAAEDDAAEAKSITVEVKDAEGNVTAYTAQTEAEFLYDALQDVPEVTLDGYESDYGYYITTVNGVVADYDADGAYWSIYVNGEYGSYGVDSQPVADGDTFTLAYEVYVAEDTESGSDDAAQKNITIEVTDAEGNTESYETATDAEVLYDALFDIDGFSIDGYMSDWGYYVTTVNGVVADYDADGAYWSLYVNGEYGAYGVDSQPVADGDVYTFAYEIYEAEEAE